MLLLLRTFVDIIALRKGPDSVPASWLVLAIALVLMGLSSCASVVMIDVDRERSYPLMLLAYALGILFYSAVVLLSGRAKRLLQAISSIVACGSIITLFVVVVFVAGTPLLGREGAAAAATLVLFWSVPVEGHIIARAIGQHWFVGIAIAMTAFVLQYALRTGFTPAQ